MIERILKLQDFLDKLLDVKADITVLEAGCGSASFFHFKPKAHIVGIDISEKQLQRNTGLSERILGDIQWHEFQPSTFDVIVCWNVLEHLPKPKLALEKFAVAAKEDGIIVLGLPNVLSLKGLLTKYLPHRFHVLIHRYLFGKRDAGKDDIGPFKTYLRFSITPTAIKKFAVNNGLKAVYFDTHDALDADYLSRNKIAYVTYKMLRAFTESASLGKLGSSDFIIVLQKTRRRSDDEGGTSSEERCKEANGAVPAPTAVPPRGDSDLL
jgi:SAM-dependent methyltransferase